MNEMRKEWNLRQKFWTELIKNRETFEEGKKHLRLQHAFLHCHDLGLVEATIEDELWDGLSEAKFRKMTDIAHHSIAYNLYHCTRIEDITMSHYVLESEEILNEDWLNRMQVSYKDTGNSQTVDEVAKMSQMIDIETLKAYRLEVGKQTQKIIDSLTYESMKRKVNPKIGQMILDCGSVCSNDSARWLIDFWGNKTVAGLFHMPGTRHILVHLNEATRIKEKVKIC